MYSTEDQKWEENSQNLKRYIQSEEVERQLMQLVDQGKTRLPIKLNNIRAQNDVLARDIIENPQKTIRIIQPEIQEKLGNMDLGGGVDTGKKQSYTSIPTFQVSFEGDLGRNLVTPRGLTCQLSNQLVGVQGLVTRMSMSKCKLIKSTHYCEATDKGHVKEYENTLDLASTPNYNATKTVPAKDNDGNALKMEDGKSKFINTQSFSLQELPETAPPGLLPRSIEVVLENDLVDSIKPGDRVQVTGVFKTIATGRTQNAGILKTILVATNASTIAIDQNLNDLSADDIKQIKEQSKKSDLLQKMINSIAPSIQGHDYIKQGILLQLLGGQEKDVNGHHLRGDINIMMIGDPSTAKSQMLRYVMGISPLAINTTGRGSSGVGLTAVVKFDRQSGQRTLEAGAMVLADRGIVCIDELDKMDDVDRVAIHEAMEQQTVTISKAGINCTLNARCSVIAAANPIYGEYHTDLPPTKNINLPDSLLSRFDLLFIVLDEKDQEKDRKVAERVTKNHMYRSGLEKDRMQTNLREMMDLEDQDHVIQPQVQDDQQSKGIYQKAHNLYNDRSRGQIYAQDFLSKYIKYAKKACQPELTDEAVNYLTRRWKDLRQKDLDNTEIKVLPVTVRTLESLIRLSTAFAKMRLKKTIDTEDCKLGYNLLKRSLFGSDDVDSDSDDDDQDDDAMHIESNKKQNKKKPQQKKQQQQDKKGFQKYQKDQDFTTKQSSQQQQQQPQRVTRQSQQQQTQPQQQQKQKKDDLSTQMQKIKIHDDDSVEAESKLAEQKLASIKITKQERSEVFKAIGQLVQKSAEENCSLDEVWNKIKSMFGAKQKQKLIKCLTELDLDGKIDYNTDEEIIYLI